MPFSVTDILYGGVMPAFVAGLSMLILRWLLPDAFEKRYTVVSSICHRFFCRLRDAVSFTLDSNGALALAALDAVGRNGCRAR